MYKLLCKAIYHKFLWFIGLINYWDVGITLEKLVNHSPSARDLRSLFVFFQPVPGDLLSQCIRYGILLK